MNAVGAALGLALGAFAGVLPGAAPGVRPVADGGARVSLRNLPDQDCYRIHGAFDAAGTRAQVWRVLTDYDHLAGVVAGLRSSRILASRPGGVEVEQVMDGRFLLFRKALALTLWVREMPYGSLRFREAGGPFRRYSGAWTLSPRPGGGCRVDYTLTVSRGDVAPRWLEPGLFRRNAAALLRTMSRAVATREAAEARAGGFTDAVPGAGATPPGGPPPRPGAALRARNNAARCTNGAYPSGGAGGMALGS